MAESPPVKFIKVGVNAQTRIAQACDRCRSKKIRCDGIRPCCSQCAGVGFECRTSDKLSRRAFPRGYTESLEARVRALESELRKTRDLLRVSDGGLPTLAHVESQGSGSSFGGDLQLGVFTSPAMILPNDMAVEAEPSQAIPPYPDVSDRSKPTIQRRRNENIAPIIFASGYSSKIPMDVRQLETTPNREDFPERRELRGKKPAVTSSLLEASSPPSNIRLVSDHSPCRKRGRSFVVHDGVNLDYLAFDADAKPIRGSANRLVKPEVKPVKWDHVLDSLKDGSSPMFEACWEDVRSKVIAESPTSSASQVATGSEGRNSASWSSSSDMLLENGTIDAEACDCQQDIVCQTSS